MLLALLVLIGGVATARTAHADEVDENPRVAALGLEAVAGIGGYDVPGAWRPITVTLAPDAPLRGRILLSATWGGTSVLQSREFEVGAGTQKRYLLLAPPRTSVQVQVVEEGRQEAVTVTPRRQVVDGVLVGVLGGLDPREVPPATLPMTDQRATPVAVDDAVLDLGPRGLQSLGTLVVRQADLRALPADHRAAVARHVADGASLVVLAAGEPDLGLPWRAFSERTGGELVPAPGAWGATADGDGAGLVTAAATTTAEVTAIAAGRGRLVATAWDLGAGPLADIATWEHLLQPGRDHATLAGRATEDLPGRVEQAFDNVVGQPPSVGWLALFFVLYVVVAGPVVGVVLSRRRRPEVAWVVLPLVTALFAGAAFVGATGARPRVGASARVVSWLDGQGTTLAVGGVRAPQAGQHTITLPGTGWDVANASWSGTARVAEGQDTTVTLALPGQSFGAVLAEQPLDAPPPLEVEVALFDGEARVEVTNTSDTDLHGLTLRLATVVRELRATLPTGETHVETVALPDTLPGQRDPFADGFRGAFDLDRGPDRLTTLLRWGVLDGAPGTAWVTATTSESLHDGVRSVDDASPVERGTLVAVGVSPPVTDDTTTPFEVQRDLVAVDGQVWPEGPLTLSGTGPATMRFRLPAEGQVTELALALERGCCGNMIVEPRPVPMAERCGSLEIRDAQTGDLLQADDLACSSELPCPPDAVSCEWVEDGGPVIRGRACFADETCRELEWTILPDAQPVPPPGPRVESLDQLQLWDHVERRWVDLTEVGGGPIREVTPWLGPLGDVWVRATGEFSPFDLGPQGVAATLRGAS